MPNQGAPKGRKKRTDVEKLANTSYKLLINDIEYEQKEVSAFNLLEFLGVFTHIISIAANDDPGLIEKLSNADTMGQAVFTAMLTKVPRMLEQIIYCSITNNKGDIEHIKANATAQDLIAISNNFWELHSEKLSELMRGFVPGLAQAEEKA